MISRYRYRNQTEIILTEVPAGTVSRQSHLIGISECEPLIITMDSMIRYAEAYEKRFEQSLVDEPVLCEAFIEVIKGIRGLLNGDGAVAMERNITTDSKDNGAVEAMFWEAVHAAGLKESDLNL